MEKVVMKLSFEKLSEERRNRILDIAAPIINGFRKCFDAVDKTLNGEASTLDFQVKRTGELSWTIEVHMFNAESVVARVRETLAEALDAVGGGGLTMEDG